MSETTYIRPGILCCLIAAVILFAGAFPATGSVSPDGGGGISTPAASGYYGGDPEPGVLPSYSSSMGEPGGTGNSLPIPADTLELFEGMMVDSVVVRGNARTRSVTVTREMATRPGEPLDPGKISRDFNYIRGMGYFSDIDISIRKSSGCTCKVIVTVSERPDFFMKYPYPVLNYDIDDGISYGIKWKVKNFRGLGERISIYAIKRRDKEHGGNISWNTPWMLGRRIRFGIRYFNYRRLDEPVNEDFIKGQNGGSISLGIPLSDNMIRQVWLGSSLKFESRHAALTIFEPGTGWRRDYYYQKFISLGLSLNYDSRDNRITPSRGIWAGFSVSRERSVDGIDQKYSFFSFFNNYYFSIPEAGTFILSNSTRIRDGDVPWFFRMEMGGAGDLRGYESEGRKGCAKIINTIQWRKRLFGPNVFSIPHVGKVDIAMNLVVFYDNGTLMDSFGKIGDTTLLSAGGMGFEILSPFQDLLRAEMAINEEGGVQYYWTSGIRF